VECREVLELHPLLELELYENGGEAGVGSTRPEISFSKPIPASAILDPEDVWWSEVRRTSDQHRGEELLKDEGYEPLLARANRHASVIVIDPSVSCLFLLCKNEIISGQHRKPRPTS
jgi:hypothetical protein